VTGTPSARRASTLEGVRPLLDVAGLSLRFGGVTALRNVTLRVQAGAAHAVIGPNGAGKTTLFNCINRFELPDTGSIHFENTNLLGLPATSLASIGIARTFQHPQLFPNMTVLDNVLTAAHARMTTTFLEDALNLSRRRAVEHAGRQELLGILVALGLDRHERARAADLPYGQQKMLELARALATRPKLLLLDEPSAGLSPQETESLKNIIRWTQSALGVTPLLIAHDMYFVMGLSDRVTVLDHGVVIAEGSPSEVQQNRQVQEAYLGAGDDDA